MIKIKINKKNSRTKKKHSKQWIIRITTWVGSEYHRSREPTIGTNLTIAQKTFPNSNNQSTRVNKDRDVHNNKRPHTLSHRTGHRLFTLSNQSSILSSWQECKLLKMTRATNSISTRALSEETKQLRTRLPVDFSDRTNKNFSSKVHKSRMIMRRT